MNILVAGGAGFIGSHLIDSLLAEGHRVICADKPVGYDVKESLHLPCPHAHDAALIAGQDKITHENTGENSQNKDTKKDAEPNAPQDFQRFYGFYAPERLSHAETCEQD